MYENLHVVCSVIRNTVPWRENAMGKRKKEGSWHKELIKTPDSEGFGSIMDLYNV